MHQFIRDNYLLRIFLNKKKIASILNYFALKFKKITNYIFAVNSNRMHEGV